MPAKGIPAFEILANIPDKYKREMINSQDSLSIAIFEYFSSREIEESNNALSNQYYLSILLTYSKFCQHWNR